jgi:hypothetical protein
MFLFMRNYSKGFYFEILNLLKTFFFVNHRNEDTASSSTDPYTITGAGFQFLLMNRRSQVWFFIIHSLETRQVDFYSFV